MSRRDNEQTDPFARLRGMTRKDIWYFVWSYSVGKDASRHPPIMIYERAALPRRPGETFEAYADRVLSGYAPAADIRLRGVPRRDDNGAYAGHWWNIDECVDRIIDAMGSTPESAVELLP